MAVSNDDRNDEPIATHPTPHMEPRTQELSGFNKLVHARHGTFVVNRNDTYIGRAMIEYGECIELEWVFLQQFAGENDIVIDVGANIGTHTVNFAKAVGPSGRVVAIEPQPVIFQTLCANLALNSLTNTDAVHCGCGNVASLVRIPPYNYAVEGNFGGISLTESADGVEVEVRKLDDLFHLPRLKLIKIDVEGMEADVIDGARRVIETFHPVLYVENDRQNKSKDLIELIANLGYRTWWHLPPLYNSNNYFGNTENIYKNIVSINMLCVHSSVKVNVGGLREVTDSSFHPMAR